MLRGAPQPSLPALTLPLTPSSPSLGPRCPLACLPCSQTESQEGRPGPSPSRGAAPQAGPHLWSQGFHAQGKLLHLDMDFVDDSALGVCHQVNHG